MWVQIRFRPGSFKISRDTHSEWSHKFRGTVTMIMGADGAVAHTPGRAFGSRLGGVLHEAKSACGFVSLI